MVISESFTVNDVLIIPYLYKQHLITKNNFMFPTALLLLIIVQPAPHLLRGRTLVQLILY